MKQFKKLSALILSLVLLLAAIPTVSLSVAAAVDPAELDVRVDFAANQYAVNATYALENVGREEGIGLVATKRYNYVDVKVLPGSAVVTTFTIPEGEAAPTFQVAPTANGIWADIVATEAVDGTTRTYTIDSVGAANSFVRIVLPVYSKDYALKTLAFDFADTKVDFTALSTATVAYDMSTIDGVYDYSGTGYYYHVGQKRLDILNNGELIFKVAAGSPFEAYAARVIANASFSVSPDGIHWTPKATYAYECTGTGGYDAYHWYMPSVGENNQFVKMTVTGAEATSTDAWKEYLALYTVSYQKSTAVLPVAEERETTDDDIVPVTPGEVDVTTLDVNVTFNGNTADPLLYTCDGANIERNGGSTLGTHAYRGTIYFNAVGGYAVFKTDYNSPFVTEVRTYQSGSSVSIWVSPDAATWTQVTPVKTAGTTYTEGQLSRYTVSAIGSENQYVKVQMDGAISALNYIRSVAFNENELDATLAFSAYANTGQWLDNLYFITKTNVGLVSFGVGSASAAPFQITNGNLWILDSGYVVFETTPASPFVVNFAVATTTAKISVASSLDGTWEEVTPLKMSTTQFKLMSVGANNKYVKVEASGGYLRLLSALWSKEKEPAAEITVQDVTLETEYTATGIEATVAYDADKLEYKGFYNAAGEATVTDNGNGTLSVAVTATEAVKGDWITLVLQPKADVLGSAAIEVTDLTATGGEAANLTAGKTSLWFDTATEGNVLVEFDDGTTATAYEAAPGSELTLPATPERAGYEFAGWYTDNGAPFTATTYPAAGTRVTAKWVNAAALTVKAQLKAGTTAESDTTNVRLVSTVDDLDYVDAGFVIQIGEGGKENTRTITTVYNRLKGAGETYTPWDAFSTDSRYFFAFNIRNIPRSAFGTAIIVTPFWTTPDGATVYGTQKTLTVNELLAGENA